MRLSLTLLLALCCSVAATLCAQNAALTVQGILKKSDGSAVPDDVYTLRFALYNAEAGGTEVWFESLNDVETTGGVYSAVLGLNPAKPLNAPFDVPYYLSVKIGNSSQELLPRPRLSAAPYALALRGQDNVIPSTGNIQAYGLQATHNITVNGASQGFRAGTGSSQVGYSFTDDATTGFGSSATGTASIWAAGQNVMNATSSEVNISKFVHITGSKAISYSGASNFFWNGGSTLYPSGWPLFQGSTSRLISLETDNFIKTDGVFAISDRRIKKDFTPSNAAHDLSQLMRLRVTDYKYKDVIGKGDVWKKGFIAQEVAEIEPEGVYHDTGVIPDIYAPAQRTRLEAGTLHLVMEQAHGLKPGDKVRIMGDDHQEDLLVQATPSATIFTIGNWAHKAPEKVFVYGREVNDFHSVDYNRIFTMNISATQELARRVESLEKENASFKSENTELRQMLEGLRADVEALKGQR